MTPALRFEDVAVRYGGTIALDRVTLDVQPGESVALLGESGSGKSTLARAALGLIDGGELTGSVRVGDVEIVGLDSPSLDAIRWQQIALAFQAAGALNPAKTIREQIAEPVRIHTRASHVAADARALEVLERVGLPQWAAERLPAQLSGGQRRLALVAVALACDPGVLVLDEPTSGLDPVARRHLIDLVRDLVAKRNTACLVLTHDVDFARAVADRAAVLYRGWIAEVGPADEVLRAPENPYTWGLLNAVPTMTTLKELRGIRRGVDPAPHGGCPFVDRCTQAIEVCAEALPPLVMVGRTMSEHFVSCHRGGRVTVLSARGLVKSYHVGSMFQRREVPAVRGIDLDVRSGEVVGVLGSNGSGKSTLCLMLASLLAPDRGEVSSGGQRIGDERAGDRPGRWLVQLVQQDPFEAVSPRMSVAEAVGEPLDIQEPALAPIERRARISAALGEMRLPLSEEFLARRPHELSGGQLQRVCIARALILAPRVLILDEPVAMLDPSEQAELLQLLKRAQVDRGMAMVIVSHDLPVLFRVSDRVVVLEDGLVVEEGRGDDVLRHPHAALTRALLAAWNAPGTSADDDRDPVATSSRSAAIVESESASPSEAEGS